MAIALIILFIWFFGWVLSIYPAYKTLVRQHQINLRNDNLSGKTLKPSDVWWAMVGASGLATVWFLALPFVLSQALYKRRRPSLERDTDVFIDDFKHALEVKAMYAKAAKAIETTDHDDNWRRT